MQMDIGENIRTLRREAGMTQEELANQLCVSAQAVSRWETGTALPELTIIPLLTATFGVSADTILGTALPDQRREVSEVVSRARMILINDFRNKKWTDEPIRLLRAALKRYPMDPELRYELALELYFSEEDDNRHGYLAESIRLTRELIKDSTDEHIKRDSIVLLYYSENEKNDIIAEMDGVKSDTTVSSSDGRELDLALSDWSQTADAVLINIAAGRERADALMAGIAHGFDMLIMCLMELSRFEGGAFPYPKEERERLANLAENICRLFFDDSTGRREQDFCEAMLYLIFARSDLLSSSKPAARRCYLKYAAASLLAKNMLPNTPIDETAFPSKPLDEKYPEKIRTLYCSDFLHKNINPHAVSFCELMMKNSELSPDKEMPAGYYKLLKSLCNKRYKK